MKNKLNIDNYCMDYSEKESPLLKRIREKTYKYEDIPAMICGPLIINVLKNLIRVANIKKILEIGMFTGYSAMAMAEALPNDGKIHTCELMLKHVNTAKNNFEKSNHKSKIYIYHGKALKLLDNFSIDSFDMVFIDADKINYINYYNRAMMLIKNNGIIVLDNMLWGGEVLNPQSPESKIINELNTLIINDKRNSNVLLPIRDGLMICIKNDKT